MSVFTANLMSAILILMGFLYLPTTTLSVWFNVIVILFGILFWFLAAGIERETRVSLMQLEVLSMANPQSQSNQEVGRKIA